MIKKVKPKFEEKIELLVYNGNNIKEIEEFIKPCIIEKVLDDYSIQISDFCFFSSTQLISKDDYVVKKITGEKSYNIIIQVYTENMFHNKYILVEE